MKNKSKRYNDIKLCNSYYIKVNNICLFKNQQQRLQKYTETKVKAFKARNEYILSIDSANACINKFCSEDIGDIVDVREIIININKFFILILIWVQPLTCFYKC